MSENSILYVQSQTIPKTRVGPTRLSQLENDIFTSYVTQEETRWYTFQQKIRGEGTSVYPLELEYSAFNLFPKVLNGYIWKYSKFKPTALLSWTNKTLKINAAFQCKNGFTLEPDSQHTILLRGLPTITMPMPLPNFITVHKAIADPVYGDTFTLPAQYGLDNYDSVGLSMEYTSGSINSPKDNVLYINHSSGSTIYDGWIKNNNSVKRVFRLQQRAAEESGKYYYDWKKIDNNGNVINEVIDTLPGKFTIDDETPLKKISDIPDEIYKTLFFDILSKPFGNFITKTHGENNPIFSVLKPAKNLTEPASKIITTYDSGEYEGKYKSVTKYIDGLTTNNTYYLRISTSNIDESKTIQVKAIDNTSSSGSDIFENLSLVAGDYQFTASKPMIKIYYERASGSVSIVEDATFKIMESQNVRIKIVEGLSTSSTYNLNITNASNANKTFQIYDIYNNLILEDTIANKDYKFYTPTSKIIIHYPNSESNLSFSLNRNIDGHCTYDSGKGRYCTYSNNQWSLKYMPRGVLKLVFPKAVYTDYLWRSATKLVGLKSFYTINENDVITINEYPIRLISKYGATIFPRINQEDIKNAVNWLKNHRGCFDYSNNTIRRKLAPEDTGIIKTNDHYSNGLAVGASDCAGVIYQAFRYGAGKAVPDGTKTMTGQGKVVTVAREGEPLDMTQVEEGDIVSWIYGSGSQNSR